MPRYRRNLFSGEWEELPFEGSRILYREDVGTRPQKTRCAAYARPLFSRSLSVHPEQAKQFNEDARHHGITGVYYDEKGDCYFETRQARRLEAQRRQFFDHDGGYSDAMPQNSEFLPRVPDRE